MTTVLGDTGTMLADTPVGLAIFRVSDAVAAYCKLDENDGTDTFSAISEELAASAIYLCKIVLDLMVELGVTEVD